jgi:hypothetical protein
MSLKACAQRLAKGGFVKSDVPGRTDKIAGKLPPGAFVIPADIVSALGEGNSNAGAQILDGLIRSEVWGGSNLGAQSSARPKMDPSPVIVAGGEYVIMPDVVAQIGGGSMERGHKILDAFVRKVREKHISTLQSLPGPKR